MVDHRGSDTVERALSSHALFVRVRSLSAAILAPDLPRSSLRSTSALTSPEGLSSWSTPSSGSPERLPLASRCLGLGVVTWMAMLAPLARPQHQHVACGSLRRLPIRSFHASVSCDFAAARRPARFASPGSARVANLSALFHAESSMGTLPSEVSPRSSPPDPLGSCRPPCRFPSPLQVMPRFRGFELFNAVSPCGDIHSSNGCVLRRRRCSRLRRVAPLLVVVPLRGLTFRPRSTLL